MADDDHSSLVNIVNDTEEDDNFGGLQQSAQKSGKKPLKKKGLLRDDCMYHCFPLNPILTSGEDDDWFRRVCRPERGYIGTYGVVRDRVHPQYGQTGTGKKPKRELLTDTIEGPAQSHRKRRQKVPESALHTHWVAIYRDQ